MAPGARGASGAAASAAERRPLTWTGRRRHHPLQVRADHGGAGATTIVFENSAATGNTTGMPHTLTFDTTTEGYNHDVNLNILASPFDANNGRHQATVTLTPGRYRYFCSIPGHSQMVGEFVVTGGGGERHHAADGQRRRSSGDRDASRRLHRRGDGDGHRHRRRAPASTTVEYQVDDTSFLPYTAPVVVTAIGDHSVQFRATDEAGNVSPVGSVAFTVVAPAAEDTTPPTVAVDGGRRPGRRRQLHRHGDGHRHRDRHADPASPAIEYVARRRGLHPVHRAGRGEHGRARTWCTTGPPTPPATPRPSRWSTLHRRRAAPEPDTTPPTTSAAVTGQRDGTGAVLGSATVTVTATDTGSGVGVDRVRTRRAGVDARTPAACPSAHAGAHTVRYRATDIAGNRSAEKSVTFTVVPGGDGDCLPRIRRAPHRDHPR